MKTKLYFLMATVLLVWGQIKAQTLAVREVGGWFESGYVTWNLVEGASSYQVSYRISGGEYHIIDGELVRNYGTYGRADIVGLKAGEYQFKVIPLDAEGNPMEGETAETEMVNVRAHDRSGFAHLNHSGVGAYNDNGTLKSGAKVLYITRETAKTVTCDIVTNSKGTAQTFTGLQTIIDAKQKGYDLTPLAIRIIGTIEAADMDKFSSSAEGLQIKGKSAHAEMNITLEGVGRTFNIHQKADAQITLPSFESKEAVRCKM